MNTNTYLGLNNYQGLSEAYLTDAAAAYKSLLGEGAGGTSTTRSRPAISASGGYVAPTSLATLGTASTWKPDYASQAGVTAQQNVDAAQAATDRELFRRGINPNSGKFAGTKIATGLAGAAAKTGAMTKANREANQDWFANLLATAGLGVSSASAASGAALSAAGLNEQSESRDASLAGQAGAGLAGLAGEYGDISEQYAANEAAKKSALQESFDAMRANATGRTVAQAQHDYNTKYLR